MAIILQRTTLVALMTTTTANIQTCDKKLTTYTEDVVMWYLIWVVFWF
jgi:hypothetical protein